MRSSPFGDALLFVEGAISRTFCCISSLLSEPLIASSKSFERFEASPTLPMSLAFEYSISPFRVDSRISGEALAAGADWFENCWG
jgi:hypothetical protein